MTPGEDLTRMLAAGGLCFTAGVLSVFAGLALASGIGQLVVGLLLERLWKK
jgi:hypothetical protein